MAKKKATTVTKRITTPRLVRFSKDYIIRITPKPKVVPGSAHVVNGQRVTWVNQTGHRVRIQVFADIMGPPFFLTIEDGEAGQAPGDVDGDPGDRVEYAAVDLVTGRGIPGNSPPDIIIE